MPRLGGSNEAAPVSRNEATAYATSPISRLWSVVLFLALVFVLRNMIFYVSNTQGSRDFVLSPT